MCADTQQRSQLPSWIVIVGMILAIIIGNEAVAQEPKEDDSPRKPYQLIYQMDTSGILPRSKTAEEYLKGVVNFLDESHVDALFWHDGAGGNTANYDSEVLELTGERSGERDPFLLKLIEEGNDPPRIVVDAAKNRGVDVFYSFRINDCHDSFGIQRLLPSFKLQHPEWTIGEGHPYGPKLNLNFAVKEVRDLKFAVIEEVFRKYDFDGLEIDFLRSPPYFIPGQEPANAHLLTGFVRRIRDHLRQRGEARGRPITLAVRVDENLEACRLDGFDVAIWTKDGLIDLLILGSGAIDIDVEAFKKLAKGTDVLVYPCVYGWPSGYMPAPVALHRALAMNYWHQGADGIYTFNWNVHSCAWEELNDRPRQHERFAHQAPLLLEIDDPIHLRGKDKLYAADRGGPKNTYPHNWMHCVLPATLENRKLIVVPITVGEDISANTPPGKSCRARLSLGLSRKAARDSIALTLNGAALELADARTPDMQGPAKSMTSELDSKQVRVGVNSITIELTNAEQPTGRRGIGDPIPLGTDDISISMWVKQTGHGLFWRSEGLHIELNAGGIRCKVDHVEVKSIAAPRTNTWTHVAIVIDREGTGSAIYLDGKLQALTAEPGPTGGVDLKQDFVLIGRNFIGLVDDFALYGRVLSASEVAHIHKKGSAGVTLLKSVRQKPEPTDLANGLLRYFKFDEPIGTSDAPCVDSGPQGHIAMYDSEASVAPGLFGNAFNSPAPGCDVYLAHPTAWTEDLDVVVKSLEIAVSYE
jgi:hypothetical protein